MTQCQKLYNNSNNKCFTAYHKILSKQNNKLGIIFLGGFKSDMNGTKASALAKYALENNLDLIRFDYQGHGSSSGKFIDGTIGLWLENTINIIDELCDKPQVLVGSSMGGWLMLLAALARPSKIARLIGLAAAPDFTEELIWNNLNPSQKETLLKEKIIDFNNEFCDDPYPISLNLIEEARNHLLLNKKIPINIPIDLIHGMEDKDVPFETALRIAEKVSSKDVNIHLLKNAGHGLSQSSELEFIFRIVSEAIK